MADVLNIPILLGSVRRDRQSPKVAHWLHRLLKADDRIHSELVDLEELAIPIMEERLRLLDDPPAGVVQLGNAVAGFEPGEGETITVIAQDESRFAADVVLLAIGVAILTWALILLSRLMAT